MAVEGTKIREMMEGKTLEKDNIKKMYDMVQNASEPEDKKKVMKHSVFFIGQLPLKENHIVDLEQTRRIVNGSVPFSEVDTYMDYLLKGLSTQKLLLEKEDGSYEVNTKYEKSVIKVRKIARAFQLEKEKALEAGIPKAKKMYQMGTKYYHSGQYEEAAACFMNAAELAEYRMAYYSLALMYFKGQGVDQSFEEALYYARKALVKGAVIAQELEQEILEAMNAYKKGYIFIMKKFATIALAVVLSMGILTGCGSSKKAAEATTEVKEETVDYGQGLNEDGTLEGVKATDYVTVCDYSALKIPKKEVKVSDSDVQTEIDTILSSYNQVTDRKVKKGDTVNIDYKGMVDGKEFDGGTASGASLKIGSGTFIDGFEDQLIGKMPGETVQVKVTFPKDYQGKEVAGKDAVFETTINYIDETPKLTDKFVKEKLSDRYGYTTVKEMKKTIRDEIFKTNKTDYIWNHMIEKSKFKEIPDELINDRVDVLVNGLKAQLKASNYTLKDYLSAYGIEDETTLRDQYKSSCESTVKVFLIADAIAADKKISVTDEDVKAYFNGEDTAQYEKQYSKAYINRIVLNNLVIQEIEKNVTVK